MKSYASFQNSSSNFFPNFVVSSRKWKKINSVQPHVPDVPAAEGNVAGPGQHQRGGVVQAPGQLTAEDAQVQ
jgi:hypothetical protein